MVVGGDLAAPTLGILGPDGRGVDLRDCGLYEPAVAEALPALGEFIARAALTPYDLSSRRGELKHVLVTGSPDGELMVRFVARSREPVARVRKHLPWLRAALPAIRVVSVNLQPEHKAIVEGPEEIVISGDQALAMRVNGVPMALPPGAFFQTNTGVAAALYRQARTFAEEAQPRTLWDLYCGVGGFALHLAAPGREVIGVELSAAAIRGAELAAAALGLDRTRFLAADVDAWVRASGREPGTAPEMIVVNPPRRGLGPAMVGWLKDNGPPSVLYSSCNPESLARDLAAMPRYRPRRGQVFDMFPHTVHAEVLVLLGRLR